MKHLVPQIPQKNKVNLANLDVQEILRIWLVLSKLIDWCTGPRKEWNISLKIYRLQAAVVLGDVSLRYLWHGNLRLRWTNPRSRAGCGIARQENSSGRERTEACMQQGRRPLDWKCDMAARGRGGYTQMQEIGWSDDEIHSPKLFFFLEKMTKKPPHLRLRWHITTKFGIFDT